MPIVRKKLAPADVYPENIRYNADTDQVQSLVNGEWVDNPAADPRKQTTFPPHSTGDTQCDAAQAIVDALKAQLDATEEAVGNAATAATIAGLILGLFTFGLFEIFISIALFIANTLIDAGETALEAALTDPVYDTLKCILDCHMTDDGRINPGELPVIEAEVTSQIGGLGAVVINSMLSLAGEGGLNNLASLGMSSGDCSGCGCEPPCGEDWTFDNLGGGDPHGELVGIFDGYRRYASTNNGGSTQQIFLNSGDPDTCCQVLDFRVILNPESVTGTYKITCGLAQSGGNLSSGIPLGSCVNFIAMQTTTGADIPFTLEVLFAGC